MMPPAPPLRFALQSPADISAITRALGPYEYATDRPAPALEIALPGGVLTERYTIQFGETDDPNLPNVTILGNGSAWTNGVLNIAGRNITIRDLVIGGGRPFRDWIDIYAAESLTFERVAIVNVGPPDRRSGSRRPTGISLFPIGPAVPLTFRDSVLLDNAHTLYVNNSGAEGRFAPARFERVRVAGNVAPAIWFQIVERVEFVDSIRLGTGGELHFWSPRTLLLSEPTPLPEDATMLAAWRAEVETWGARAEP